MHQVESLFFVASSNVSHFFLIFANIFATSNQKTLPNRGDLELDNLKKSFINNLAFDRAKSTLKTYVSP